MAGSIDPRCETLRGIHWPVKVAGLFGTRVAETILASGPPNRINRPDIWMQAIRSDHQKLLRHGGRPHMGPGSALAPLRLAGTTRSNRTCGDVDHQCQQRGIEKERDDAVRGRGAAD